MSKNGSGWMTHHAETLRLGARGRGRHPWVPPSPPGPQAWPDPVKGGSEVWHGVNGEV